MTDSDDRLLSGRGLRFVLVDLLMTTRGEVTVAELAAALHHQGYQIKGRASKTISDALRWEVRRGRVGRPSRGRYCYRRAPTTTARRIRLLAAAAREWVALVRQGRTPPPARPNPRRWLLSNPYEPGAPPWRDVGWLWVI